MFAFIAGEWQEWKSRAFRRSLPASAIAIALAGAPFLLHPLAVSAALTLLAVAAGWAAGNRFQATGAPRAYLVGCPLSPGAIFSAKAVAGASLALLHAFFVSPALALCAILWGLPLPALATGLACWLAAFALAQALGSVASLLYPGSDALFGLALSGVWMAPGFIFPAAGVVNPFVQSWTALRGAGVARPLLGALAEAAAAGLLFALAAALLAKARRTENA